MAETLASKRRMFSVDEAPWETYSLQGEPQKDCAWANLSYDEATSYMEVDEPVFSLPMPPEVYRWLEAYVLEHYVPERKKKRKRDDWKQVRR